jgi:hypothetical protein
MKNKLKKIALVLPVTFYCFVSALACAVAGCAGVAVAESIKGVSEIAAANAMQTNAITVAQLSTLDTDLAALPATPLPGADNKIIASVISEALQHKAATPTDAAAVDALNGVLGDVMASHAPTAADGVAWANLQDAVAGFKKAVTLAQTP